MSTTTLPSLESHAILPPLHMSELLAQLGDIDPSRVRLRPAPGTATEDDCLRNNDAADRTAICELIDGTLVEKAMGVREGILTIELGFFLALWVKSGNFGYLVSPDTSVRMKGGNLRQPDISYFSWNRTPNRRQQHTAASAFAPDLAVEILSPSNTIKEMLLKRQEYFATGCSLVWQVDGETRTVAVYTSVTAFTLLTEADILTGGAILPGFSLTLKDFFAELDRHG